MKSKLPPGPFRNGTLLTIIAFIFGGFAFAGAVLEPRELPDRASASVPASSSLPATQAQPQMSTLDSMAAVFHGNFSRDQIEREAVRVLRLFGLPTDDENYSRLASMLIELRKTVEPNTEMDILRCIYGMKRDAPNLSIKLPEAGGICAGSMQLGLF